MSEIQTAKLREVIEPLRTQIINHPVYAEIKSVADLNTFMQFHVYAVWDFMSLLKALQQNLTCTTVPWFPKGSADTRFLINEIVVGEESDVDAQGNRKSHFELYLEAMTESGADTSGILRFTRMLAQSGNFEQAFAAAATAQEAKAFVEFTFNIIGSGKDYLQAAIFTFGREDLIPSMFLSMIRDLDAGQPLRIDKFRYYLERHIEVDGDHHSHLALAMTAELCGQDAQRWQEAETAVCESLSRRITLWNGALRQIRENRKAAFATETAMSESH